MDKPPLSDSNRRVADAASANGLLIEIELTQSATRTAEEAAAVRGCDVAQIVKSLIFRGKTTGAAVLLLVSGSNRVDEAVVASVIGEALERPDAQFVREVTGFAIGGIPPFGHRTPLKAFIDRDLLMFEKVYAAAGTPNSTFAVDPRDMQRASGATAVAIC